MFFILSKRHSSWNNGKQESQLKSVTWIKLYLRYLHQDQNLSVRSLSRRYPQFSLPTIWRHATKKIEVHPKNTTGKGGRKLKLSLPDERSIIRSLHYARKQDGNFTSKTIRLYSGVSSVHDRTVGRVLNKWILLSTG